MSRFVRASKFRHVYGTAARRENCYENIRVSTSSSDSNLIDINPKFISINWEAAGGGAFAVIPLANVGRLPADQPLFNGHSGAVLDTSFSNFDDNLIASGSEDAKIMLWRVPDEPYEEHQSNPLATLSGHYRKVGHVLFHPTAENVLASSSYDLSVKVWDVEKATERQTLDGHTKTIQSIAWNNNGNLLATTCQDKAIRIFDVRAGKVVQEGVGQSIKSSRVVWLGDADRLMTAGFSRTNDRQLALWNAGDLSKELKTSILDASSGSLLPFYDSDTKVFYVAGKGDGNIRYFEIEGDEMYLLSEYKSTEPQRGIAFMPKRALNINGCEIARAYKVTNNMVEPIAFVVPRRAEAFQADLFPPTYAGRPSLTADEYFDGKSADPILLDLTTMDIADGATIEAAANRSPSPLTSKAPPNRQSSRTEASSSSSSNSLSPNVALAAAAADSGSGSQTPAQRELAKARSENSSPKPEVVESSSNVKTSISVTSSVTGQTDSRSATSAADVQELEDLRKDNARLREQLAAREARVRFLEEKVKLFFEL